MSFDSARIAEPTYFAENRLAPHSDHRWFASADEAAQGVSSFEQSLNGVWKFHYAKNPAAVLPGFEALDYDCSGWDDIAVPGHLQLQGYDRPQYVNVQYPWDGHERVEPGEVPRLFNPVGSYVTWFCLNHPMAEGERVSVSFKGAESAVAVWLNGHYLGFGADSFTPSEFDLTDALVPGENKLAAQVFKWTSGSWIEDQDFYRFSGLFRDVVLYRRPVAHAEDLRVSTEVAGDLNSAELTVSVALQGAGSVRAHLEGVGALSEAADGSLSVRLVQPRLWSAEHPHLYELVLEVLDTAGAVAEVIVQPVGVRRFGIENGLLAINGQRIVFKGVNRHEFGLNGRVVSRERTEADIRLLKAAGVNAVRTSHYPNNSHFYELCDRYGLYVIDEINLESHGHWDALWRGRITLDQLVPGDREEWRPVLLDRAANLLQRDKNHPSVVIWSCGNESYGGTNILAVSDYFRAHDSRPVHYEGVHHDERFPQTSDVRSEMYTPAREVEGYLATHRDRPFILCEFAHAMGNSFGAVERYVDLAYREPLFQGGFIWDFADQAIALTDRYGTPYFGYGGDCGEAPSDYEFSANGIVFADHSPTPKLQEVKYLYQGFVIAVTAVDFEVTNRLLFTASSDYECVVSLAREGVVLGGGVVDTDVAPGASARYPLPFALPKRPGEYTVEVSFRLPAATAWAPAGYEVAYQQEVFAVAGVAAVVRGAAPELIDGIHNVGVRGRHFSALFSKLHGGLVSYRFGFTPDGGNELLQAPPRVNFWHAPTSNERGWGMPFEDGQWLLASRYAKPDPEASGPLVSVAGDVVEVRYAYLLPTTPVGRCEVAYRVRGDGHVTVTVTASPGAGLGDPPEFGMLFTADADLHRLTWYGEGPQECSVDRRGGARLGVYSGEVRDQLTPYVRPQEAGSHTGVRWAAVTNDRGLGLRFDCPGGMEFSALPWTPFEIENAAHPNELPPIHHTVLRPALMRRGVAGDNSWGARAHPEYRLPAGQELVFTFGFEGVR
ncbi:glycoside hydrolase family 2 TIM barrel-domain containing protein [Micropruina sp.]|uniref:glycoside hydrolase family 2 TIM barrel-domain containing protein n=1 Tax=Micropruina sp. TaxID=2737536 RepID=UPI0039E2FE92